MTAKWDPWRHLEEEGYRLVWGALPHVDGAWVFDCKTIILHPSRTETAQRSALTEELAHAALDHRPVTDPIEMARTELRARRWAAIRLVELGPLMDATRWTTRLDDIAALLNVEPDLVTTRIEMLTEEEQASIAQACDAADSS